MNERDVICPLFRWMPRSHRYSVVPCGGTIERGGAAGIGSTCNRCVRRWTRAEVCWLAARSGNARRAAA